MDLALQEVFARGNKSDIIGQDDVFLDKLDYAEGIATIYLRGGALQQETVKALRIAVKLTIEDMLSYSEPIKSRNMIPVVKGFRFKYSDKSWYVIPKSGYFTVSQSHYQNEEEN